MPRSRRLRRWGLALGLGLWAASAWAQPQVRVMAETRIELAAEAAGGRVQVLGVLRDDLGQALPGRTLLVATRAGVGAADAVAQAPPGTFGRREIETDARGEFDLQVPWVTSAFVLTCAFAGDTYHQPATVERVVDPTLADVRLRFDLEDTQRELDLDQVEHDVSVWANASTGSGGMSLSLLDELNREHATATTNREGVAHFEVSSEGLGEPGPGRWVVVFEGDSQRAAARAELPIVRLRATTLDARLEADELEIRSTAVVRGHLSDAAGPVGRAAVGIFAGPDHVATVMTDQEGAFEASFEVPASQEGHHWQLEARFAPETPGRRPSHSAPMTLRVTSPFPLDWIWLLIPLGVSLAVVAFAARRERGGERVTAPPKEARPGVTVGARGFARRHRHDRLAGVVLDHQDGRPLVGAEVRIERVTAGGAGGASPNAGETHDASANELNARTDVEGRFVVASVPAGQYRLRISSPGYVPIEQQIEVPHKGEWSDIVVRVESYRAHAQAAFRRVAAYFVSSERAWSTTTNQEVPPVAPADQQGPVQALADATDAVYYGPAEPNEADVAPIKSRAQELQTSLERDPSERNSPE